MEVAFLALNSEKLGEHVEDTYHLDFDDNIFSIGAVAVKVPRKIWKQAKGRTSQQTLMYGCDGWATWYLYCPEPLPSGSYIENKLKLFNGLRILNSSRIKGVDVGPFFSWRYTR
jgi:hypothetical protein